ncbi:N-acyl-D-amino-acid deacylase family protein [Tautonia sociabilis]|uniref:D-aminoacylase n=1 Tax=Tautonia sociabilis TaxID=2080755 RepID=A0A432MEW5_9BACT|nr:D-aminoacylase [Tautonia sociabilis]RUL84217.1 D-aminoacylase [Tautonia sociabilis]
MTTVSRLPIALALVACLLPTGLAADQDEGPYDLIIRGGRVVDGTGNPWRFADVAIRGDRVAVVGRIPDDTPSARTIDATGLVVAPGFIDIHSHSDRVLFESGAAESKIRQGVTTDILGEHTSGGPNVEPVEETIAGEPVRIASMGDYLSAVERSGIAINVASYAGLGNIWGGVMGASFDRPTESQFQAMEELLDRAMADGALGLSTMIMHPQSLGVTVDDLARLCGVVARHGGIYSSHIRTEGEGVMEAIAEAIAVGELAGVPVEIIHLKIADQSLWGRMDEIVATIDAARARGVDVQANVYPYTRGNNDLVSIIPPWAHEGGRDALLSRLADPEARERMKVDILAGLPGWYNHYLAVGGDWSRMLISAKLTPEHKRFEGKTMDVVLAGLAAGQDPSPDPLDLMFDFLRAEGGSIGTIYAHHTEEDMNLALVQPWCSIGSDGSALAIDGPLRRGHPHPRNFGTFPRVLGHYVRERQLLGLEEAIRKMTSQNAAKAGLLDRGLLRPGAFADVTVFDPETVIDRSTYLEPFQYSEGITHVVVNGTLVLDDGRSTGARPGRALRRER